MITYCFCYEKQFFPFDGYENAFSPLNYNIIFVQITEALFQSTLKCLIDVVNSETATLASVAMQALGHIGLRVPLPPLVNGSDSGKVVMYVLVDCLNVLSIIHAPRMDELHLHT